jgi:hypothetical protein
MSTSGQEERGNGFVHLPAASRKILAVLCYVDDSLRSAGLLKLVWPRELGPLEHLDNVLVALEALGLIQPNQKSTASGMIYYQVDAVVVDAVRHELTDGDRSAIDREVNLFYH